MEKTSNKLRTPSRSREWERQRRNKFNEAISRLGEVVKEVNKPDKDVENIQYPKVEIVQNAVLCLKKCAEHKAQLEAEVLALRVKLEVYLNKKNDMKDASTQVSLSIVKNNKYMKLVMLQKSKRNVSKDKVPNKISPEKTVKTAIDKPLVPPKILPKIINPKKPPENTIVVLPATPYVFPQRPLLFPTIPPAIVLVDPNVQGLNKLSGPVVNRSCGDVTKTTMVNILPISAYSRPLSATKTKRNNTKFKKASVKKNTKVEKHVSNLPMKNENKTGDISEDNIKQIVTTTENKQKEDLSSTINSKVAENKNTDKQKEDSELVNVEKVNVKLVKETGSQPKGTLESKIQLPDNVIQSTSESNKNPNSEIVIPKCENDKPCSNTLISTPHKIVKQSMATEKTSLTIDKDKQPKLQNILDSSLCDAAVDGGNARLELAEEFLAASPTAAFLMSFPLVSGNRAESPAEEPQNSVQNNKENNSKRTDGASQSYFEKSTLTQDTKQKTPSKSQVVNISQKANDPDKFTNINTVAKQPETKTTISASENPFLNLPMPSLISSSCTLSDSAFGVDFDCNINKSIQNQSNSYTNNENFFYKSNPFNTVKSTIYNTNNISSNHDFNNLSLYPCAMEKYTSKGKCDYPNVEENLMKMNSSRLTYDIDLGWSHKSFDFVNCTTSSNTINKDTILTTVSAPYSSSYNPFNPEFHVPLTTNSSKKENIANKTNTSFADSITSFYSQPTNLWSDDVPFYTNNSVTKTVPPKQQNYLNIDSVNTLQLNASKVNIVKHCDGNLKQVSETAPGKATNVPIEPQPPPEKYIKKSPNKTHINWMTSEIRHMENNCNPVPVELKDPNKTLYNQSSNPLKKQDHGESYFPISMHNFTTQPSQDEFQIWPSARQAGPVEITMEPPPINLPTLVGDLALGPHEKKKNADMMNRTLSQTQELQNCSNFLSVTQLMNRSTDNLSSKFQGTCSNASKSNVNKLASNYFSNDANRKNATIPSRLDSQIPQPCYGFPETKPSAPYDAMIQFSHSKSKTNKSEKITKSQKNSYSAEALIRSVGCSQKLQENGNIKFPTVSQKYNEFNPSQDSSVAQVSHFPPIVDYTENGYSSQHFSGTTLYNTTTNTISNSFYSNLMPGGTNLMTSNYANAPFSSDFIDYNQSECNYSNHKYEELKMRNNSTVFSQEKAPLNYKSSRREATTKHKLECAKKESSKKYQSKRTKINHETEEWNDPHQLWHNKVPSKRPSNLVTEEITFPNYMSNQMPSQYQAELFNSHLVPTNVQGVGHNTDRSLSFPASSRANFNLSTIFPEITMVKH